MKKWMQAWILISCMLLLAGCSEEVRNEGSYVVYYYNTSSGSMDSSYYMPESASDMDTRLLEVLTRMTTPPEGENRELLLPEEVELKSYRIDDDRITLDFSEDYYRMKSRREILARAGFVKALCQIPEINEVAFTVEDDPLKDSYGNEIAPMNAASFVDNTGMDVNSYKAIKLSLYFLSQDSKKMIHEERSIYYNASIPLERVVIEELIAGPEKVSEKGLLASDTELVSISEQDGTCFVSFNEAMAPSTAEADPELCLQAMVEALADNCGIQKVQFSVNGSTDAVFGGSVRLDRLFTPQTEKNE